MGNRMYRIILLLITTIWFTLKGYSQVDISYRGPASQNSRYLNIYCKNSDNDTLSCQVNNSKQLYLFSNPEIENTNPILTIKLKNRSNLISIKLKNSAKNNIVKIKPGYSQVIVYYYYDRIYLIFSNDKPVFEKRIKI